LVVGLWLTAAGSRAVDAQDIFDSSGHGAAVGFEPFTDATTGGAAPAFSLDDGVRPAAALAPAEPLAPGLGPTTEFLGPPSPEVPPAKSLSFWHSRRATLTWLSKGGADGFGTTDLELATSLAPIYFDEQPALLITPGFGWHFWNAPAGLELPSQVYDAYLDVAWRTPLTDRWGFAAGVTPGWYSDFQTVNSDAFQITGWATADVTLTPTVTLVGGVAVVRQLESSVLPVGGVIWSPDEATRVELLVPRVRLARRIRSGRRGDLWTYVSGQFGGGSWAITLADETTTLVTYSDLRAAWGLEWVGTGRFSAVAEIGYVFYRDIRAFDVSQFSPDDAVMLRVGGNF
jgi:hypothetical protein